MRELDENFTNPLPQKAEYDIGDHLIYGNQKKWKKVIEWILTIVAWAILLSYVLYLIYGSLAIKYGWYLPEFTIYTREMVLEIQKYFFILFIALLILTVLLIFWKNYNLRRFGKLHRRKFRPPVDEEELAKLFELDIEYVKDFREQRVVVLETNIVPPELGMGRDDDDEDEDENRQ